MLDADIHQPFKTPAMLQKAGVLYLFEHSRRILARAQLGVQCWLGCGLWIDKRASAYQLLV
jgi:hypothetical protein